VKASDPYPDTNIELPVGDSVEAKGETSTVEDPIPSAKAP
jgi:hypothetical protein